VYNQPHGINFTFIADRSIHGHSHHLGITILFASRLVADRWAILLDCKIALRLTLAHLDLLNYDFFLALAGVSQ
jgi:hypothetical protein